MDAGQLPRRGRPIRAPSRVLLTAALLLAGSGCGGNSGSSNSVTGPQPSGDFMRASLDGQAWAADLSVLTTAEHARPGEYIITGTRVVGNRTTIVELELYNIAQPGTYPLGVQNSGFGGMALVADGGSAWNTPASGAAGSLTVTSLTATRIAATFSFTATSGSANPASRVVSGGQLDLPLTVLGNPGPLPANAGGRLSATLGGSAWNAAETSATNSAGTLFIFSRNDQRSLSITIMGFTGPETYSLSGSAPLRLVTLLGPDGTAKGSSCCWNNPGGNTGSVTITSLTATRVTGTFSATLAASANTAATGPMAVSGGQFDIGLQ